jgi:hypothetical protein
VDERKTLRTQVIKKLNSLKDSLSRGEFVRLRDLIIHLGEIDFDSATVYDLLLDLRGAAIKAHPGLALTLGTSDLHQPPDWEAMSTEEDDKDELIMLEEADLISPEEDNLVSLESNEIAGVMSLYHLPDSLDAVFERIPNTPGRIGEEVMFGNLRLYGRRGTLYIRGNQLVRITVPAQVFQALLDIVESETDSDEDLPVWGLFDRCICSENIFLGGENRIMAQHLTLTTNNFTRWAMPNAQDASQVELMISDTSIYTGNHGNRDRNVKLENASRERVTGANLGITFLH